MILPQRATVRPRVYSPLCGDAVPLEDVVARRLAEGKPCVIALCGGAGAGKTTALRHLAAVLPADATLQLADDLLPTALPTGVGDARVLVCTLTGTPGGLSFAEVFELAPWGEDELIEYLLDAHRGRCASVMRRLDEEDHARFAGIPDLWQVVLDQLAADESLPDARAALHRHLAAQLADTDLLTRVRSVCLNQLVSPPENVTDALAGLARPGFAQALLRVLRHRPVQVMLAVERMTAELRGEDECDFLARRLPRDLVHAVALAIHGDERVLDHLRCLLAGPTWSHAMAASLLHAVDHSWVPAGPGAVLTGAYLEEAAWPRLDLTGARLDEADLSRADLREAVCDWVNLSKARLVRAALARASLRDIDATGATLTGADLTAVEAGRGYFSQALLTETCFEDAVLTGAIFTEADLRGAVFLGADLRNAWLREAVLEGADFTGASLDGADLSKLPMSQARWLGASFAGAHLMECDLEGLDLTGANFWSADLTLAYLTGASMAGADLRLAKLNGAGLADVDWENADLRGADLSEASFHLGSSRSGLVMSPIASEGSRTGFYTDDYEEQHFQPPEQIRKANLQGADLRGAIVERVDFYLVDLRGAQYDPEQEQHFRRCRAIL